MRPVVSRSSRGSRSTKSYINVSVFFFLCERKVRVDLSRMKKYFRIRFVREKSEDIERGRGVEERGGIS